MGLNSKNSSPRLGILGAGQLSSMLLDASKTLGLRAEVYSGALTNPSSLKHFFLNRDVVVFENEFVDCDLLTKSAHENLIFCPDLKIIKKLQDKLQQKKLLKNLAIPTSEFIEYDKEKSSLEEWLKLVRFHFNNNYVIKWSRLGYDGKGVLISPQSAEKTLAFAKEGLQKGGTLYAEQKIDFEFECALISVFSTHGDFKNYPLVQSTQQNGICYTTVGPLNDSSLLDMAIKASQKLTSAIPLYGTFALEFFKTKDQRLIVNEIAPRVHNTGHYTLDAGCTSQFENHIRAVLGQPLGSTEVSKPVAMLNLLGPAGVNKNLSHYSCPPPLENQNVHWYKKVEARPGRKLGHVNCFARNAEKSERLVQSLREYEKLWIESINAHKE